MDTITRIRSLAKEKGITNAFICSSLGLNRGYLVDCAAGKAKLTDDRIERIAGLLNTTAAYLRGETDKKEKDPITDDEVLNELLEIGRAMTPAQRALLVEKANQILGI